MQPLFFYPSRIAKETGESDAVMRVGFRSAGCRTTTGFPLADLPAETSNLARSPSCRTSVGAGRTHPSGPSCRLRESCTETNTRHGR